MAMLQSIFSKRLYWLMKIIGRKIKLTKAVKASIAFFIASIVTSGISYLVTPIYTNLLTTDEYGKTSVFMTWLV